MEAKTEKNTIKNEVGKKIQPRDALTARTTRGGSAEAARRLHLEPQKKEFQRKEGSSKIREVRRTL